MVKATVESLERESLRKKVLKWLAAPDTSTNANHARNLRHEGTGSWILKNSIFQDWKLGLHKHLWLHGIPGCGKTVISTVLLDHLSHDDGQITLRFFFDFNEPGKQTTDGMLRSFASQLSQGGFDSLALIESEFRAHQDGKNQPTTETLQDLVRSVLAVHEKATIVVDALDESTTRNRVLSWIRETFCASDLGHVQMIYTSREEADFVQRLPDLIGAECCLSMDREMIDADIRSYVTTTIQSDTRFTDKSLSEDLIEKIRDKVGNGANGM